MHFWFHNAPFGDCLVRVDEPALSFENLHGLEFERRDGAYLWTGRRTEWVRPRTFKSRGERDGTRRARYDGD